MLKGLVEVFNEHRGDGLIRTREGEALYFHCVNIADGSRNIALGAVISARRDVGRLGHDEAVAIVKEAQLD